MDQKSINELRHSFKANLLKSVLIRFDYTGINSLDNWIEKPKDLFYEHFTSYERGVHNNAQLDLTNLDDIAKTLSIPVTEIKKETVHVFTGWKMGNTDDVKLSISAYYLTLNVVCKNYTTIDNYINFISEIIKLLYQEFGFFNIRRVGIRKVGGDSFLSKEDVYKVFKPEYFFGRPCEENVTMPIKREYKDAYMLQDKSMKINYTRLYRLQNTREGERHQVLLDLDGYVDKYIIEQCDIKLRDNVYTVLNDLNSHLFELFHNSVQQEYIDKQGVI